MTSCLVKHKPSQHTAACPFPAGLTVLNAIDLIYQPLVRQLRGQRGQQVHVAVQQQEGVKDRKYGILAPRELTPHPDHHVGHVLQGNHIALVMEPQQMDMTSGPCRHMLGKECDGRRYRLANAWGRMRLRKQKSFSAALSSSAAQ